MRIDAVNKVNQLYEAAGVSNGIKSEKARKSDKCEISESGKAYQTAKQAVKMVPDVREDLVKDIKERIATGTYSFDSEEVADMLVERYFDAKA